MMYYIHRVAPAIHKTLVHNLFLVCLVIVDQSICRTVVTGDCICTIQFGQDLFGQGFAKLHTPLIKTVNIPNGPLRKNLHLVRGNQNPQHPRSQLLKQKRRRGPIPLEHLMRHQLLHLLLRHLSLQLLPHLLGTLPKRHRLRLRKVIRQQNRMMIHRRPELRHDIVVSFDGSEEIAGDDLRPLVDELIKGVLSVRSGFAPNDRSGLDVDLLSVFGDVLPVGFHVPLLEVGGEAMHVLIVREDGEGFGAVEVIVPNADEGQCEGEVLLGRGIQEVLIHGVGSGVHFHPGVEPDGEGDGGSDGAPLGVPSADPVPEAEHVVGVDAEFRDGLAIGGEGDEVLGHAGFVSLVRIHEPLLGGAGVGHGLLRGEGLGGDEEERRLGVALLEDLGDVRPVHVGAEVHGEIPLRVGLERLADHDGAQVRPPDADVHDGVDALARVALPVAAADLFGEDLDLAQHFVHFGHDVRAVHVDGGVALISQRHVEDGAFLGVVDLGAGVHFLGLAEDVGLLGQLVEEGHGLGRHAVFGVVQEEVFELEGHFGEAGGVTGEQIAEVQRLGGGVVGRQGFPGGEAFDARHGADDRC
mmetsp:Transcript_30247/g.63716  ORF Transcript_30247/g.63716 Transcript_30247/m.63716 type:complete len:581 (-) Transcript_30247:150-1892(-)